MKGLAKRASLNEGSARAMMSYKAKVASLTSEKADLRAQIRDLTEEHVKHRYDLKHASMARAQVEDKEKKGSEGLEGHRGRASVGQRGVTGCQG